MPEKAKSQKLELWFQDEARVGQQGNLSRIWAKTGTRPRIKKDQRFKYCYIFGAVCPARDMGAALILPYANTDMMNLHLGEISNHIQKDHHAVILMDGAGWHKSKDLEVPDNMTLIPIPPYSPELNPTENIWQYLKSNFLNNRIFDDYEAIVDACSQAWNKLTKITGKIAEITQRNWGHNVL